MNKTFERAALAAVLSAAALLAPAAHAGVAVSVTIAPPPLPYYVQPPIPGDGYLWTPGYWSWDPATGDYVWVPGTWVLPPAVGLLWTPGWWGWSDGFYRWHAGYWGSHVGFYAGRTSSGGVLIFDAPKPGGVVGLRTLWTTAYHIQHFGG